MAPSTTTLRGVTGAAALLAAIGLAGCTSSGGSPSAGSTTSPIASSSGSGPGSAGAGAGGAAGGSGSTASPPASAQELQSAYQTVIRQVLPSVVEIRTSVGLGSGIVYDSQGDIVTNAHVVGTSTTFAVLVSGTAKTLKGTLVGRYTPDDVAVVHVSGAASLRPAAFADSSKVQVGDIVLAMGNPLGLESTVTDGIVSAVDRTVSEPAGEGSPGATLPDTIQTSAAINPGNSGGALVTLDGRVIGIPTLAATTQQTGGAAPGIGFAISANRVKLVADQLIKSGKVTSSGRAALGIRATTVQDQSGASGAGVVEVTSGGAAAAAGIQAGDVITSVAGHPTPTTEALSTVLADLAVGRTVPVTLVRNGQQQTVQVTLGQLQAG